jgi:hypothetical protein
MEDAMQSGYEEEGDRAARDAFLSHVEKACRAHGADYLSAVENFEDSWRIQGTAWLQSIVDRTVRLVSAAAPALGLDDAHP